MEKLPDRVEREVQIDAPIEQIWALVSEPGWWVNDGEIREHTLRADAQREGVTVVTDPQHGEFSIETVRRDEPSTIVYRWLGGQADSDNPANQTLVTFTLQDAGGHTTLRVVESGWSSRELTDQARAEYEANEQGWEQEMAAAKKHIEAGGVAAGHA